MSWNYLLRRLGRAVLSVWLIVTITFFLTHVIGNPVAQLLPVQHTQQQYDALQRSLGYDRPVLVQYVSFLSGAIGLDFGRSVVYNEPAMSVLASRLPVTGTLAGLAIALALVVGIPLGMLGGRAPRGLTDRIGLLVSTAGQAIPTFVVAIGMIMLFSVELHLFPPSGWGTPASMVMPTVALALWAAAGIIRLARSGVIETMPSDFVLAARARGVTEQSILSRHVLGPILAPLVAYTGMIFGLLLTGAVVIESVFQVPGAGSLVLESVSARDNNVVLAAVVVAGVSFVIVDLLADFIMHILDPRIRVDA